MVRSLKEEMKIKGVVKICGLMQLQNKTKQKICGLMQLTLSSECG
jgi:hypothetical protein